MVQKLGGEDSKSAGRTSDGVGVSTPSSENLFGRLVMEADT